MLPRDRGTRAMDGWALPLVTAGLVATLARIAWIDVRAFRIPDRLSLPLVAAGIAVALWLPVRPLTDHLAGAVAGYAVFAVIGAWYFRRRGIDGLGLGDAKLLAAAGAWLGWQALPWVVLAASLGGLAQVLARPAARRRDPVAFGPWLALAFALVWTATRLTG